MSKPATTNFPGTTHATTPTALPHEKVAARAYENWVKRGKPHGSPEQDWKQAEQELRTELARTGTQPTNRR
jgi:hypothetical protein